jgi:hypothetical protein
MTQIGKFSLDNNNSNNNNNNNNTVPFLSLGVAHGFVFHLARATCTFFQVLLLSVHCTAEVLLSN